MSGLTHYAPAMVMVAPPSDPGVNHAIILTRCDAVNDYDSFNLNARGPEDKDLVTCKECRANLGGKGPLRIHHLRDGRVESTA